MFCPKCKTLNQANATVCSSCGEVMPHLPGNFQNVQASADATAKATEYYKAILGPQNQDYYLDMFARFDRDEAVSATWHWPALLANFFWLLYRKMWPATLIYLAAFLLLVGLMGVIGSSFIVSLIYILFALGMVFLPPVFANAVYYQHCKKLIATATASSGDVQQQLGELAGKGGTINVVLMGVVVLVSVVLLGVVAAIAIPAYQGYSAKSRTTLAYALGQSAASKVSDFYTSHQAVPTSLSEAGFAEPIPSYVRDIGMSPRNGAVTVTMEGAVVGGKSFTLEPSLDVSGQLNWRCMSEQIQDSYLPQQCRHQN